MPIHFLWGDEDFLIEKEAQKIRNDVLKGDINPLNYMSVDNPSFALLSELLRTNAMMFGDIVIQIKCSNFFLESRKSKNSDENSGEDFDEAEIEQENSPDEQTREDLKLQKKAAEFQTQELVNAIQNISPKVHVILICPTPKGKDKKPDSRKKLYKELVKITTPLEFKAYKNYESYKVVPVIKKMASEYDLKIDDKTAGILFETTGASLRDIDKQLEKLKLYAYPENIVKKEMVEQIADSNVNVFVLIDFILKKDWTGFLKLYSDVIQKQFYLAPLALLQTTLSNMLKIKVMSLNMSVFDIAKILNQHEFKIKKTIEQMKNTTIDELARLKINITHAEYQLKTGMIKDPLYAFEMAFLNKGDNL